MPRLSETSVRAPDPHFARRANAHGAIAQGRDAQLALELTRALAPPTDFREIPTPSWPHRAWCRATACRSYDARRRAGHRYVIAASDDQAFRSRLSPASTGNRACCARTRS